MEHNKKNSKKTGAKIAAIIAIIIIIILLLMSCGKGLFPDKVDSGTTTEQTTEIDENSNQGNTELPFANRQVPDYTGNDYEYPDSSNGFSFGDSSEETGDSNSSDINRGGV